MKEFTVHIHSLKFSLKYNTIIAIIIHSFSVKTFCNCTDWRRKPIFFVNELLKVKSLCAVHLFKVTGYLLCKIYDNVSFSLLSSCPG